MTAHRDWHTRFVVRDAGHTTPCREWTGARNDDGYGVVRIAGKTYRVHRLVWTEAYGDPGQAMVLHQCDNPPCARLDHLYLGDHARNGTDAYARGLHPEHRAVVGVDHPATRLTEADVLAIRATDGTDQRGLALRFGVSQGTISNILLRKTWRHL